MATCHPCPRRRRDRARARLGHVLPPEYARARRPARLRLPQRSKGRAAVDEERESPPTRRSVRWLDGEAHGSAPGPLRLSAVEQTLSLDRRSVVPHAEPWID